MKSLPDTSKWVPRQDASETLRDIFFKTCLNSEKFIIAKSLHEQQMNIDKFDSGLGLEDIIKEELGKLLPNRYSVTAGVINDRNGSTSGDHDFVVFNKDWFPYLKYGATNISRRFHFPIEGVYALGEIKQTLTLDNLDDAMKKLVVAQRLHRPKTSRNRIVENRELSGCEHGLTNPLYTFILARDMDSNATLDEIFIRFFEINKTLKRHEIVRAVCVLQKATITWAYLDPSSEEIKPAMFAQDDLFLPIFPILISVNKEIETSLYYFVMNLSAHLYNSVLGAEDLVTAYGDYVNQIKVPPLANFTIT